MKLREALIIALSICPFQGQLMDVGLRFRGSTRSKEQALLNGSTWGGQTSSYRSAARADPLDSSDLQQRSDAIEEAKSKANHSYVKISPGARKQCPPESDGRLKMAHISYRSISGNQTETKCENLW